MSDESPGNRTDRLSYPPRDLVTVDGGVVGLEYVNQDRIGVHSGRDLGWLAIGGAKHYATSNFVREDGEWRMDRRRSGVFAVVDDKAGPPVSEHETKRGLDILEAAFRDWMVARPDISAEAAACVARRIASAAERDIAQLEVSLVRRRGELKDLHAAVATAEAESETVLAGMRNHETEPKP